MRIMNPIPQEKKKPSERMSQLIIDPDTDYEKQTISALVGILDIQHDRLTRIEECLLEIALRVDIAQRVEENQNDITMSLQGRSIYQQVEEKLNPKENELTNELKG